MNGFILLAQRYKINLNILTDSCFLHDAKGKM